MEQSEKEDVVNDTTSDTKKKGKTKPEPKKLYVAPINFDFIDEDILFSWDSIESENDVNNLNKIANGIGKFSCISVAFLTE